MPRRMLRSINKSSSRKTPTRAVAKPAAPKKPMGNPLRGNRSRPMQRPGGPAGQRPTGLRAMQPPTGGGPLSSQGQNIQRQARAMQRPGGPAGRPTQARLGAAAGQPARPMARQVGAQRRIAGLPPPPPSRNASLQQFGGQAQNMSATAKPVGGGMKKGGEAKKKPPGLYANIHAKRKRIAAGSNEKMRKVGSKGAPTKAAFIKSAKTAKKGK